jgi:hypothetical protein
LLIRSLISSLMIPLDFYYSLILLSNLLLSCHQNYPPLSLSFTQQFFSESLFSKTKRSSTTPRQQAPCPSRPNPTPAAQRRRSPFAQLRPIRCSESSTCSFQIYSASSFDPFTSDADCRRDLGFGCCYA